MLPLIDPKITDYCLEKSHLPPSLCDELETYTQNHVDMAQMLSGKMVASFLGFLLRSHNARRVLEVGTYTGYSALAMASELPSNGQVVTLDISPETTTIAKEFWARSQHGKKILSLLGPALDTMDKLDPPFDLVFIDADKKNYLHYLQRALKLTSPQGIIVLDNCLWGGKVLPPHEKQKEEQKKSLEQDEATTGIKEATDFAYHHQGLYSTLLPIRDGLLLIHKKRTTQ